jgi:hypothetical protein
VDSRTTQLESPVGVQGAASLSDVSVVAPPAPPRPDDLELLIREARARQLKRRIGAVALVALMAGGATAAYSIATGGRSKASRPGKGTTFVRTTRACGIRVAGPRILASDGQTMYREPLHHEVNPSGIPSQVRCSGPTIWVVWFNGAGMSQEGYVGARSIDGGQTWKLVFSERFFGVDAPHQLVTGYLGVWTLGGSRDAYFTGLCVACGFGTVGLWVTKDAGRTFRHYPLPALAGYGPTGIRISGRRVTIRARRGTRKTGPRRKVATLRVA